MFYEINPASIKKSDSVANPTCFNIWAIQYYMHTIWKENNRETKIVEQIEAQQSCCCVEPKSFSLWVYNENVDFATTMNGLIVFFYFKEHNNNMASRCGAFIEQEMWKQTKNIRT